MLIRSSVPYELLNPVVDTKPRYPLELADIVGDKHQAFATRMGPNKHIVHAPKGVPSRASSDRIWSKCATAFTENGITSSLAVNCSTP